MAAMNSEFRGIPSVDRLLSHPRIAELRVSYADALLLQLARRYLAELRASIAAGRPCPTVDQIAEELHARAIGLLSPSLRPVVNASGVVLHTNLGRAPLSRATRAAMDAVAAGYCNLEFDLESGRRGHRAGHVEALLCELTGAEAAVVVNNNAAAVLLALTALARRREVVVSRSQAVQIGGGFRIPDVMRQSGAKLVDVGTTNCTYMRDYEEAIGPKTAALMRVHSSNFRLMGFTHLVTLEELVRLGQDREVPVFDDLGSGCLLDTARFGLQREPMVQESIAAGASLVFSSGDKLLGGPQAGIVLGKEELVRKLQRHPLARAVRVDKVRLAGLAATLSHYARGEAISSLPVWQMIAAPVEELELRAGRWVEAFQGNARVVEGETMVGGGSLPGGTLPTRLVAIGGSPARVEQMARFLRAWEPPVVGRISEDVLLLDPRTVLPGEDGVVQAALEELSGRRAAHRSV